jgi:hypothetical protein
LAGGSADVVDVSAGVADASGTVDTMGGGAGGKQEISAAARA